MRGVILCIAALAACAIDPTAEPPAPDGTPPATPIAIEAHPSPIFRSGTRLKIQWAVSPFDPTVRVPISIFDTQLDVECEVEPWGSDHRCLPNAHLGTDDVGIIAFGSGFDEDESAMLVPDSECDAPTRDHRIWSTGRSGRFTAETPRWMDGLRIAGGYGCLVDYQPSPTARCARPLVPVPMSTFVTVEDATIPGAPIGIRVGRGLDGSILPFQGMKRDRDTVRSESQCATRPEGCGALRGTGRLQLRMRPDANGVPAIVRLHDAELDADCEATRTADGTWRCVVPLPPDCFHAEQDGKHYLGNVGAQICEGPPCCQGGIFFSPAVTRTRHGIDPRPSTPEHVGRYSGASHEATLWQSKQRVWDLVSVESASVFAELRLTRDP